MNKSWTLSKNFPADLTKLRSKPEKSSFEVKPYFCKKVNSCFQILNQRSWISENERHGCQNSILRVQMTFLSEVVVSHHLKKLSKSSDFEWNIGILVTNSRYVWKNCSVSDQTNFVGTFFPGQIAKTYIWFWTLSQRLSDF